MGKDQEVTENILRGLSSQIAEREDANLCSDVRNKLFGPMEFSRRDLASLNIMRGRDNGLPDYNTVNNDFNHDFILSPTLSFNIPEIQSKLINFLHDI